MPLSASNGRSAKSYPDKSWISISIAKPLQTQSLLADFRLPLRHVLATPVLPRTESLGPQFLTADDRSSRAHPPAGRVEWADCARARLRNRRTPATCPAGWHRVRSDWAG